MYKRQPLSRMVGEKGLIYAIDMNEENLKILEERLRREGIRHVNLIHDPHLSSRIHPTIGRVDAVFSLGMLGYIRELKPLLRDIHRVLPEGGKICFIDYIDFFKIFPNPEVLRDLRELEDILVKEGFSVRIKKIKGLLWNYLVVYGVKTSERFKVI